MSWKTCCRRTALLETYRECTEAYTIAVKQLTGAIGADYDLTHKRAELARQKMIAARENLALHLAVDHCSNL
jgi:hypothetical protein